tara:strand:+ start:217 stop:432 length:216 start_codon:yes stop_codon:yes gene_type:complete
MVRTKLKRCTKCKKFGLKDKCDDCEVAMEIVAPLKYSPEDFQGARRRKRLDAGSKKWIESLPSIEEDFSDE